MLSRLGRLLKPLDNALHSNQPGVTLRMLESKSSPREDREAARAATGSSDNERVSDLSQIF